MHSDEMSSNNPVPKIPMMTQSQDCIPMRTDSAFFSCLSKSLVLQTKKPERRCPRVWRHLQMPHQHSFCKGEQAMSEGFNTIPIHFYSPLLPVATTKSHQPRCGGISQRKKHLLEQDISCSVYVSVVSTSTRRAHDRHPLVIRHLGV